VRDASYEFLMNLLSTPDSSGNEGVAKIWRTEAEKFAEEVRGDEMGNSFATLNGGGAPRVILAGRIDEIGLVVTRIDDQGLIHFTGVGGWHPQALVGQRVLIETQSGEVPGVIGNKVTRFMESAERKKASEIKDFWIDIGAKDCADAKEKVKIGHIAVIAQSILELPNGRIASSSLHKRIGAFVVLETLKLLSGADDLAAEVVAVTSVQEKINIYGARDAAFQLHPDVAIAVDDIEATDTPDGPKDEYGDHALGSGPVITWAANLRPIVSEGLVATAEQEGIAYTLKAESVSTGMDGDALQFSHAGVAMGLVSIPNRYTHSPNQIVVLEDLENCATLIAAYVKGLKKDATFVL
jgi:putative aminopeptidase FrvX